MSPMRLWRPLLGVLALLMAGMAWAGPPLEREILAISYHAEPLDTRFFDAHRFLESILNHLGLTVRHHDLREGLPPAEALAGVRGVLLWFPGGQLPDPLGLFAWTEGAVREGKRLVLLGNWAFEASGGGRTPPDGQEDRLLRLLGLRGAEGWVRFTYNHQITHQDPQLVGFEHPPPKPLPPFQAAVADAADLQVVLGVTEKGQTTPRVLVSLSSRGGYAAPGYFQHTVVEEKETYWVINPLEFFRRAFATDDLPKPDITTRCGRRLYYSHIDGDGWRNLSEVDKQGERRRSSARIILEQAIRPFPDLPVSVAPIAAELHPDWHGDEEARQVTRELFALPQVEPASHTFTHLYAWSFFAHYTPQQEAPFRQRYSSTKSQLVRLGQWLRGDADGVNDGVGRYELPRTYLDREFDLELEISGAKQYLESFAPPGKPVALLQWSGDTTPFEAAIVMADQAGMVNLNGGDSRLDAEFSSLVWVAPVGRRVGRGIQIYSSNSNENTYTNLWTTRFFGFRYLASTVRNTDSPVRLKPFNVYYHMYSGEKVASLKALLGNLTLARSSPLHPIKASQFARIGLGFFSTRLLADGEQRWRVEGRGALQTLRFDRASLLGVDFARSLGVLGQRHLQGSLYVALDPAVAEPVVALRLLDRADRPPAAPVPYLVESRWGVQALQVADDGALTARVEGFGPGEMRWWVPRAGRYRVTLSDGGRVLAELTVASDALGVLDFTLPANALAGASLRLAAEEG